MKGIYSILNCYTKAKSKMQKTCMKANERCSSFMCREVKRKLDFARVKLLKENV